MKYKNPVVRGMYPDPSVCRAGDKYYMVCSSMPYFPAVPLFESDDMVNWRQIGHCITRPSQADLTGAEISSGIFAPTIRYNNGRFYMVTTNAVGHDNFYIWTDDIYGEWSDPIPVDQEGIDPSLFFEDGRSYFISNGGDEKGSCIIMSEINIDTGERLTEPKCLWRGTGGRFMEAPHLYKFGSYYYILDAEGGTEYGHMVNYGRSRYLRGPFEPYPRNPVLTNRNLGGYILQGAGHGDIVEDKDGRWWFMHLAFRQEGMWAAYHHLGRECCLVPVEWTDDGWFTIGDGTSRLEYCLPERNAAVQRLSYRKTFENLKLGRDWCFLRKYEADRYDFSADRLTIKGSADDIFGIGSPAMAMVRQAEFREEISVDVESECEEAGITLYMDGKHHYDLYIDKDGNAVLRLTIGCVTHKQASVNVGGAASLLVSAQEYGYTFSVKSPNGGAQLGYADAKYLSSEVAGGFTGVMLGLYAADSDNSRAVFSNLSIVHNEE